MSYDSLPKGKADKSQDLKDLSNKAKVKGIGSNSDPSFLREIDVTVRPSSICLYYAQSLYENLQFAITYKTGVSDVNLPFTEDDLYIYYFILIRERVNDVNKRRVMFSPRDNDIKIPSFFQLVLAHIGEVTDERSHLWIKVLFDDDELVALQGAIIHPSKQVKENKDVGRSARTANFKLYLGRDGEKEFVYAMSRQLKLMERYGLVNGSALPRGLEGNLEFMLFVWAESRMMNAVPEIEPGLSVLASLLQYSRDKTILNPYIPYGEENAYRVFVKDMTALRGME
jgi:hypothetical protein